MNATVRREQTIKLNSCMFYYNNIEGVLQKNYFHLAKFQGIVLAACECTSNTPNMKDT